MAQSNMALVIFFCSIEYDRSVLAEEFGRLFPGITVVGCTTAGEIGPLGYREHSITGASFPADSFTALSQRIDNLHRFDASTAQSTVSQLTQALSALAPSADPDNSFALLLIDGLSVREEVVASALQGALRKLPLVGGSAGDGLQFNQTHVYSDGEFRTDGAVLVLVTTPLPFVPFKTQHFVPTEQRVVVTAADAPHRVVHEIDGWPAASRYANLAGSGEASMGAQRFAASPLIVPIDGTNYIRSIQKVNPDGSLTFYCAIEEGLVLRVGRGVDLVENLAQAMADLRTAVGSPQLVLGCDCVLRKLEINQNSYTALVERLLVNNNVIGFNSYGEQYRGVHVNQTLTGIAIGEVARD